MNFFFEETYDSKNWTFFKKSKNWSFFYQYDSLQEFKPFEPFHMTQRIEHFFWDMTQWIELFFNSTQRTVSQNDTKNWTLFTKWLKELNPFVNMTHRNFSELQRKEFFLIKYASQNSKNWTFFSQISRRIELFEKHDSQNWTIFHVTHGIEPFFPTWVIEIEPFFFTWLNELNLFFEYDSKNWTFFLNFDAKNWTFFLDMTQRIDPSLLNFDTNQRIEPFQKWLKEFNFLLELCLKELNFFFEKMSRRNDFFQLTPKLNFLKWLKFFNMTQRIELFVWFKELNFFFIVTQNFNFLKWLEELRPLF